MILDLVTDLAKVTIPAGLVYFGVRRTDRTSAKAADQAAEQGKAFAEVNADVEQRKVDQASFDRITGALERRCTQLEQDVEREHTGRVAAEKRAEAAERRAVRAERAAEECNLRVTQLERRLPPPG